MLAFFIGGNMILNLYTVNDGDNVINKTKENKIPININLKRDVDISSPVIILMDGVGVNYSDFNYAEIVELGRFYFVNNVTRLNSKMIQMELSCDVLETYKSELLNSRARFYRQIKTGDYVRGNIDVSEIKTVSTHISNQGLTDGTAIILTTVGA